MNRKQQGGFTLIEMLVVIAIISILIGIGVNTFTIAQKKARDIRRKADLRAVKTALYLYQSDHGTFCIKGGCDSPGSAYNDEFGSNGNDSAGWTSDAIFCCGLKSLKQGLLNTGYIPKAVYDPVYPDGTTSNKSYYYQIKGESFIISAYLENSNDPAIAEQTCTPFTGRNYCITE